MTQRGVFPSLALALLSACGSRNNLLAPEPRAPTNACGGAEPLTSTPGTACGTCGHWECAGIDTIFCSEVPLNACGRCEPTQAEACNERDDNCDGVVDEGCVIRALALPSHETRARISDDWLVTDVNVRGQGGDIIAVNSRTREIVTVYQSTTARVGRYGAIAGHWIAYFEMDRVSNVADVHAYDLNTRRTFAAPRQALATGTPNVDAGNVVFHGGTDRGDTDVFMWNVESGAVESFGEDALDESQPDLSGEWLAWRVSPRDQRRLATIQAWNIRTHERIELSSGLSDGWDAQPAIDGARIVWHREYETPSGQNADAYLFDLDLRASRLLVRGAAYRPRVSGTTVCYSGTDDLNGPGGSWLPGGTNVVDVRTGTTRLLSIDARSCDVDGRRVAWLLERANFDPYYVDLQ